MKKQQEGFAVRASVTAVRAAMVALAVVPAMSYAADADDAVRRFFSHPTSYVEAGAGYVSEDSFKFGEYNGLFRQGLFGIFNLGIFGGAAWDSDDPTRWQIAGTDLGLETRDIRAEYGQQGRFRINIGYDELRRNRSDSFQTPYLGAGSDTLTLPPTWLFCPGEHDITVMSEDEID